MRGIPRRPRLAEYRFAERGHKWQTLARLVPKLPAYRYYAFIDEDIDVSVETLNGLFQIGELLGLNLYQPALTGRSHYSHEFSRVNPETVRAGHDLRGNHGPVLRPRGAPEMPPHFHDQRVGLGPGVSLE